MKNLSKLIGLVLLLSTLSTYSQHTFTIQGKFQTESGDNITTELICDGQTIRTDSIFKPIFELEMGHEYLIVCSKEGYTSKKISVLTDAPPERYDKMFVPLTFTLKLHKEDGTEPPPFLVKYNPQIIDFDYISQPIKNQ